MYVYNLSFNLSWTLIWKYYYVPQYDNWKIMLLYLLLGFFEKNHMSNNDWHKYTYVYQKYLKNSDWLIIN